MYLSTKHLSLEASIVTKTFAFVVFGNLLEAPSTNSVDPDQTVPGVGEFDLGPHGLPFAYISQ